MSESIELTNVVNNKNENVELVSVEQWIENVDESSKLGVGVIVKPSDDVKLLQDTLNDIALIALDFNNFDDGRGYSQAYLLSKRWQYVGEIIGINAHLDQLQFMLRSGVTSYKLLEVTRALMCSTTPMDSVSAIKQQQTIQA